VPEDKQGTVRVMPEALLAPKVIVCEGATEVGLLRAYEKKILEDNIKETFAFNQVAVVNTNGGESVRRRAKDLDEIGKNICVFMDSDEPSWIPVGGDIKTIAWDTEMNTERRVVSDLPEDQLPELIRLAISLNCEQSIVDKINSTLSDVDDTFSMKNIDSYKDMEKLKEAVAEAASNSSKKDKGWFKSVGAGEKLGDFLFGEVFVQMQDTDFGKKMKQLKEWVNE